jgi:pSer/pThr/pTyr-binding forkhead associated (FHA) protein
VSLTDGREYSLDTAPFVLGRDAQAEVVIASPDASRRHAEIASVPDGEVLVDLSANGTYVNGKRVSGRHRLRALDVIRIGAEEFRYYPAPAASPEPAPAAPVGAAYRLGDTLVGIPSLPKMPAVKRPAPSSVKPLAVLLVKKGAARGQRLPVFTPTANIGRAEYNEIRLADPSISANHGKLQLREGVWTLTDLGSTNGSAVDGIPVTDETPLSPGTVITLGDIDLLFEPHDERMPREAPTSLLPKMAAPGAEPIPSSPPPAPAVVVPPPAVSEVLLPRPHGRAAPRGQPAPAPNRLALVIGIVVVLAALAALVFLL